MESAKKLPRNVLIVYNYLYDHQNNGRWRGYGADIAEGTGLHVNMVYRCIGKLEGIGSIRKLRHGGLNSPSVYQIIKEPDGNEYELMKERSIMTGRFEMPTQWSRVQDSLNRVNNRLNEIELRLERLERQQ